MALQLNSREKLADADPSHLYVDLDIVNNDWDGISTPRQLTFNEIRNTPYLLQPNKYFFSVIRFHLDTPTLPIFIPVIEPNQDNINMTVYKISIRYQGINYTRNIFWETTSQAVINPISPVGSRQELSEYYYSYTYQHFLNRVNYTLDLIMASIPAKPANTLIPQFFYDVNTGKIKFYSDETSFKSGNGLDPTINKFYVYVNAPLQRLFSGFEWVDYGYPIKNPTSNPLQYRMKIYEQWDNIQLRQNGGTTIDFDIIMTSEQLDIALWNPVKSVVFSSGLIPVLPTLTSPPKTLSNNSSLNSFGNNSNLSSQITDFEVAFSETNTYKQTITYTPSSEYRLLDVMSDIPITSINISVFWKDIYGNLNPFSLSSSSSANLKLLFRRKDFNNTQYMN